MEELDPVAFHDGRGFFGLADLLAVAGVVGHLLLAPELSTHHGLQGVLATANAGVGEVLGADRELLSDVGLLGGLLLLGAGDNTIRLCPPLVVTRDQCDFAMETLEECLG